MLVAGVMSGTSADGINVAIVRILGKGLGARLSLLAHDEFAYSAAVRRKVLSLMNAESASVADLAHLNFLLGELYADAVIATQRKHRISKLDLVGCHGQTLFHQGERETYLGKKFAATWQSGEAAVIARRVGVPVVSDFRPADLAAGGKGAPLVPLLDYVVYRHRSRGRILQNIGGIANLTAIPAAASLEQILAFDTGPGNMLIDACMEKLYGKRLDAGGSVAAKGKVISGIVRSLLKAKYFYQSPPKTAGREEFGREFAARFLRLCGRASKGDVVATATALTAQSIGLGLKKFVVNRKNSGKFHDYIITGGGAKNRTLTRMLRDGITPLGLVIKAAEDFDIPVEAKEAAAFALLAYQTWYRQPGNVPTATGASRPTILGKVTYV